MMRKNWRVSAGGNVAPREHGGGGPLDRGQRGPQLVAYQAQKLRSQSLCLLQRLQVLQGDHHGLDGAVLGPDRRRVDQCREASAIGDMEDDLLGPDRSGVAQRLRQWEFLQGNLLPVGAPALDDLQQLVEWTARRAQALHKPLCLPIE